MVFTSTCFFVCFTSVLQNQTTTKDFKPISAKRISRRHSEGMLSSEEDDDLFRESGTGILEFSPNKAGLDVTPANYHFSEKRTPSGMFSSVAGA